MTLSFPQRLHTFVGGILRHPDTRTFNSVNTSLNAWFRYYRFLQIARDRYVEASEPYVEALLASVERSQHEVQDKRKPVERLVTEAEMAEMQRQADIALQLHLDIESFYVFANVLLDRVASTFRYYFYRRADWNHRHLMTNLERIVNDKQLRVPDPELLRMPQELEARIVKYRNTRVEHVEEPRLAFATMWSADKQAKILPMVIYSTQEEAKSAQEPSADIDDIFSLLDT